MTISSLIFRAPARAATAPAQIRYENPVISDLFFRVSRAFSASRPLLAHATVWNIVEYAIDNTTIQRMVVTELKQHKNTKKVAAPSFSYFIQQYGHIARSLSLSNIALNSATLRALRECCSNLEALQLRNCGIMHNAIECLTAIGSFTTLTVLDLSRNAFISYEAPALLAPLESLKNLRKLNLSETVDKDEDGLLIGDLASLAKLPHLRVLHLNDNPLLGEEAADADVITLIRSLSKLSLRGCEAAAPEFLSRLRAKRPELTVITE